MQINKNKDTLIMFNNVLCPRISLTTSGHIKGAFISFVTLTSLYNFHWELKFKIDYIYTHVFFFNSYETSVLLNGNIWKVRSQSNQFVTFLCYPPSTLPVSAQLYKVLEGQWRKKGSLLTPVGMWHARTAGQLLPSPRMAS